jgi:hypothetical protein
MQPSVRKQEETSEAMAKPEILADEPAFGRGGGGLGAGAGTIRTAWQVGQVTSRPRISESQEILWPQ